MKRRRFKSVCAGNCWALVALLGIGVASGAPLDELKACAERAAPTLIGLQALETTCPRLGATLSQLEVAPWLATAWQDRLDGKQLGDLTSLLGRYEGAVPTPALDTAALPEILKTLRQTQAPAPNALWQALKAWVSDWLSRLDSRLGSWVDRLLDKVGSAVSVANVLLYGLIGLVLIAAAAVIVGEMRAAGLFHRRRARATGRKRGLDMPAPAVQPPVIDALPIHERPSQLLRMLVRRLVETGRIDRDRSLTHDELVARGVFDNAEQRAAFRAVAGVAARILYGAQRPPASELEPALAEGRALLSQLGALPGAHP